MNKMQYEQFPAFKYANMADVCISPHAYLCYLEHALVCTCTVPSSFRHTHTCCYSLHPRHLLTPRGLISTHSAFLPYQHPIKLTTHIIVSLILSRRDLFLFNNSLPYRHQIKLTTHIIVSLILSRRDLFLFNNNHILISADASYHCISSLVRGMSKLSANNIISYNDMQAKLKVYQHLRRHQNSQLAILE